MPPFLRWKDKTTVAGTSLDPAAPPIIVDESLGDLPRRLFCAGGDCLVNGSSGCDLEIDIGNGIGLGSELSPQPASLENVEMRAHWGAGGIETNRHKIRIGSSTHKTSFNHRTIVICRRRIAGGTCRDLAAA